MSTDVELTPDLLVVNHRVKWMGTVSDMMEAYNNDVSVRSKVRAQYTDEMKKRENKIDNKESK
jgi:hypothetical protein